MANEKFKRVRVTLPSGEYDAKFKNTSELGFSGCEGFVSPGVLVINGERKLVQTKSFYKETYDDRGEPFTQDPDKKVRESYAGFRKLERLGFKVVPFYGMMQTSEGLLLLMDDLRKGETVEVYDEKWLHRGGKVQNIIGGRKVESDVDEVVKNLANYNDVMLELMRSHLLMRAYHIFMGYAGGTEHMITRNLDTNRGGIFITDIGEYWRDPKSKYEGALNMKSLLRVPEREIQRVYRSLLQKTHPSQDARRLYSLFREQHKRKKEFMDLAYMATVGVSTRESVGGWMRDAKWAKRIFPKNDFPDAMMQTKLAYVRMLQSFRKLAGEELYDTNQHSHDRFMHGKELSDLLIGIDFSQLAVLDTRMQHIARTRYAVDDGKPVTDKPQGVSFDTNGFPNMVFFERYNEPMNERQVIDITGGYLNEEGKFELSVELDWETAMRIERTFGETHLINPKDIKAVRKDGKLIPDFDNTKVKVHGRYLEKFAYYLYGEDIIYFARIEKGDDTSFVIKV